MKILNFLNIGASKVSQVVSDVLEVPMNQQQLIQQIHDEFDSAYDRETQEVGRILAELSIPTETTIEAKGERLAKLGFKNSVTVEKSKQLKEVRQKKESEAAMMKETAELLRHYQQKYPFQKVLTVGELKRICKKYNLIYAPVSAYKMDVPEKNLADIERAKSIDYCDIPSNKYYFKITTPMSNAPKSVVDLFTKWVNLENLNNHEKDALKGGCGDHVLRKRFNLQYEGYIYIKGILKEVDTSGLHICAPANEFDLKGFEMDDFGYAQVTRTVVKDPIVFEFMKGDICRVITKWGLEASDPSLLNPSDQ